MGTWREIWRGKSGFGVLEIDLAAAGRPSISGGDQAPGWQTRRTLEPSPSLDGPRWIYYSSGTTADPKGARHTDFSIMSSANGLLDLMGLGEADVYPIPWPITHIGGASVLASSLRGGVHLVLFENFDPAETPGRMAASPAHGPGHSCPLLPGLSGRSESARRCAPVSVPAVRVFRRGSGPQ